jgi:RNA polymerase sigma-70 factor (sigma-E family)
MRMGTQEGEFEEFVQRHWSGLLTFAAVVAGDRRAGEDLLQSALTSTYRHWPRVRGQNPLAYVRRAIVNGRISAWRRHRGVEHPSATPPEVPDVRDAASAVDLRLTVAWALGRLPERQRAVLVLRYLFDLPDAEVGEILGVATAAVRSQAARAIARLRELSEGGLLGEPPPQSTERLPPAALNPAYQGPTTVHPIGPASPRRSHVTDR